MAIAGRPAARALASKGHQASSGASKKTKSAYTKLKSSGKVRISKAGNVMLS